MAKRKKRGGQSSQQARLPDKRASALAVDDPVRVLREVQQTTFYTGPVPDAGQLAAYKDIQSDIPERLIRLAEAQIDMAKSQLDHRHDVETRMVKGLNRRADVGLAMAFVLAIGLLGGAMWLISEGHGVEGTTIAAIDLVGLAAVFIYGRHDQVRQERQR